MEAHGIRTIGIWVSGLLASGIFGAALGSFLVSNSNGDAALWGFFAGFLGFICLRLWLGEKSGSR
jgi:hypothetical protein